jgi:hypothetical protein
MEGEAHLRGGEGSSTERDRLVYRGGDLSVEGKTRLRMGRLVYGGSDSSTEGKISLRRERLVCGGGDLAICYGRCRDTNDLCLVLEFHQFNNTGD